MLTQRNPQKVYLPSFSTKSATAHFPFPLRNQVLFVFIEKFSFSLKVWYSVELKVANTCNLDKNQTEYLGKFCVLDHLG